MKKRLCLVVVALCLVFLSACGINNDNDIEYTPNATTEQADRYFETIAENDLINLSLTMAGNNDFKEEQNNYFNYLLAKITEVDENNDSEKYVMCLNVIKKCLKEPLTQANVISGFKALHFSIDSKLAQETIEYMKGEWYRLDKTSNAGMKVKVGYDEELGLHAKISALPEGATTSFKIGDVKWNNIEFANYQKFYMSDLVIEQTNGKTYFKNESKATSILKGTTATIDTEKGVIRIKYDSSSDITSGDNQVWTKVNDATGEVNKTITQSDEEAKENADENATEDAKTDGTDEEPKDKSESIMSSNNISNANVEETTKTATTETGANQ